MTFIPSDNVLVFSTTTAALTAEARASFAKYPPKTVKFDCTKAKSFQEATFLLPLLLTVVVNSGQENQDIIGGKECHKRRVLSVLGRFGGNKRLTLLGTSK